MTPKTVDRIIGEVRSELGALTKNQEETLASVRAYALSELPEEDRGWVSYRIGLFITGQGDVIRHDLGQKLLYLVWLRTEAATVDMKIAATQAIMPSIWKRLIDDSLGIPIA